MRARLEEGWGAKVTEAMGIGDIGVSLWGECEEQNGMHLGGARLRPCRAGRSGRPGPRSPWRTARAANSCSPILRHRAAPLLRFRTRDHVEVWTSPCPCGRTAPRLRCIGRTDDMLIVRGVNVFPSAIREIVGEFAPAVSGLILVRPASAGRQPGAAAAGRGRTGEGRRSRRADLAERIEERIRERSSSPPAIELVPFGTLAAQRIQVQAGQH